MSNNPLHDAIIAQANIQTKDDEAELVRKNPSAASEMLMRCNTRMVFDLAHKYQKLCNNVQFEDLVSSGMTGLAIAAQKFDPNRVNAAGKSAKFSTMAYHWIRKYVMQHIYTEKDEHNFGGQPTMSLDINKSETTSCHPGYEGAEIDDQDPHFGSIHPSGDFEFEDMKEFLHKLMDEFLSKKERYVLDKMFFSKEKWSMTGIARQLDLTVPEVREIHEQSLMKLRTLFGMLDGQDAQAITATT